MLGVVAGVSAVFALVFNPIGGALSDRTRSRFGRRVPWLVAASAGLLVMLALLGQAATVPLVLVGWCLAQALANLYQAPLTAVVPDRVAPARRGCGILGSRRGLRSGWRGGRRDSQSVLRASRPPDTSCLGVVLVLSAWYFVLTTADEPTGGLARPPGTPAVASPARRVSRPR